MGSTSLIASPLSASPGLRSSSRRRRSPPQFRPLRCSRCSCTSSSKWLQSSLYRGATGKHLFSDWGAFDFKGATTSLTDKPMPFPKKVTLVRHGLSSWNEESRVQGSSNLSVLTEIGVKQAERCRNALSNVSFDQCFASPISRAKVQPSFNCRSHVAWEGEPLTFLDSLKEAHLFFLEGMTNADAKKEYPHLYNTWREDPSNFHVDGIYPIRRLWEQQGRLGGRFWPHHFLVVTHKSILRALICTALGLGPERFRAIDVNNGAMLQSLNMTTHMYSEHVYELQ
ncbi:unnamed protein product [Spirodela intermedia]|uniref:Uncharacterized protein n=1 Tax=Spirodela intermedia TaxID=51605 RepID=A0A7I8J8K2_SPIIN|nr:unnamed protein product [Spirodela intermedia]CAA6665772.1 unnamed protein product [Spirodela intermedia]